MRSVGARRLGRRDGPSGPSPRHSGPKAPGAAAVWRVQRRQPLARRGDLPVPGLDLLGRRGAARSQRALRPSRLQRKGANLHADARRTPRKTQVRNPSGRARIARYLACSSAGGNGCVPCRRRPCRRRPARAATRRLIQPPSGVGPLELPIVLREVPRCLAN